MLITACQCQLPGTFPLWLQRQERKGPSWVRPSGIGKGTARDRGLRQVEPLLPVLRMGTEPVGRQSHLVAVPSLLGGTVLLHRKLVDENTDAQRGRPSSWDHRMGRRERAWGGPSPGTRGLSPGPCGVPSTLRPRLGVPLPGQQPRAFPLDLSRLDVDECATGTAQCAHSCLNTHGSFKCVCFTGFELGADGRQCYREWTAGGGHGHPRGLQRGSQAPMGCQFALAKGQDFLVNQGQ